MSKKPILYYIVESPPCRTVLAVANILKIDLELKSLDLKNGEQMKPEYLKLNPFHKVPTFVDTDGFVLIESCAIAKYLLESRQPSDLQPDQQQFYPKNNPKRRAQIDRWLYYDCSTFIAIRKPIYQIFHNGTLDKKMLENGKEILQKFNEILGNDPLIGHGNFLVDNQISLADISIYFHADLFEYSKLYNLDDYPNIKIWYWKVSDELKKYDPNGLFPKAIELMRKKVEISEIPKFYSSS